MRTVSIVNQKGGCGKTTTTINLAACLADQGKKTLVIDMDPQSHASLGLNVKAKELELGLYDVLLGGGDRDRPLLDDIIVPIADNLHLVPSSIVLSAFEQKLAGAPGRERRLLEAIGAMQRSFDYILIDCPPSVGLLSFNALLAAQDVIIPIEPSFFSLHGLGKQIESIQLFSEKLNHQVELHTLVTMFDKRTRLSREVLEEVGPDATRYYLAAFSPDTTINFDLAEAKRQSMDNPVYYLQYAHARMRSLETFAAEQGVVRRPIE
ncbi:MAG: AAA family ATPase, partial [bacterium]|nr:AAA family ATPase [bacterium]